MGASKHRWRRMKKTALQATSTATPKKNSGSMTQEQLLFNYFGETVPCQTQEA
nr:MAG TPA: hypothetical protein [Caudoviricetes sp.]